MAIKSDTSVGDGKATTENLRCISKKQKNICSSLTFSFQPHTEHHINQAAPGIKPSPAAAEGPIVLYIFAYRSQSHISHTYNVGLIFRICCPLTYIILLSLIWVAPLVLGSWIDLKSATYMQRYTIVSFHTSFFWNFTCIPQTVQTPCDSDH